MRLPSGTRLGPYEVVGPIGAGGMGEVYRARDTRLSREVALKIVGDATTTADAHGRFEREARTISQLSHPNVCTVHDVGREGDVHYFVMELLEGESLDQRLGRGALPVTEVLRIGAQIADGLAAAHARGIAHRDLKPGNVMLTRSGVKLLDFGLAKTIEAPAGDLSRAATIDASLTVPGALVGTIPYMAPEQIEGRPAGTPADIFALGCVLYEMATGKRPFEGASAAALMSAILASEPPPMGSVRPVPASLERIVRGCLAKDPARRWQSAADVAMQLRLNGEADGAAPATPSRGRARVAYTIAGLGVAIAALALLRPAARPAPVQPVRFQLPPPPAAVFSRSVEHASLAVSPDGARVGFIAADSTGLRRIWLRPLGAAGAEPVPGTEGALSLMWSPDGRAMAFFVERGLRRIALPNGTPVTITESGGNAGAGTGTTGSWGARNEILFSGVRGEAVYRVPAEGGTPVAVVRADSASGHLRWTWPHFLPDGEHFICHVRGFGGTDSIMWVDREGRASAVVTAGSNAQYVEPGYLLYVQDGTLLAHRFDARTGRVSGSPTALADDVAYFLSTGRADYSSSLNGTLVYSTTSALGSLHRVDLRDGAATAITPPGNYLDVEVSPDGTRAMFSRAESRIGTYDIWSLDLASSNESRITTNRNSDFGPVWLPDQSGIVYSANISHSPWLHHLDLRTGVSRLLRDAGFEIGGSITPDGRMLLFQELGDTGYDIWQLPLDGSGAAERWLATPFTEYDPRLSPDARRLAFLSNESGRFELYVTPYPGPGEKVRISSKGAIDLRWNRATGELLYLEPAGRLVGVTLSADPAPRPGTPRVLATAPRDLQWRAFDVMPDGRRALVVVADRNDARRPLEVLVHWPQAVHW